MLKQLWSHVRDIRVVCFPNKVIYDIPLYSEKLFKNFNYEVVKLDHCNVLRITIKPTISLSKEFLN